MKILETGHVYRLQTLDDEVPATTLWPNARPFLQELTFVRRDGTGYPPSKWNHDAPHVGHHPGTLLQDVLRCCIERVQYVDGQIPHQSNKQVIGALRLSIRLLETRAAERHGWNMEHLSALRIEELPACERCGHIVGRDHHCER